MSHELRTPMNSILGLTELILDKAQLSIRNRERLEVVLKSGKRLMGLINDILDLSKIEAGKLELNMGRVDVFELLNNLMQMYSMRVKDDVRIILDTPECKFSIISEKNRLSQVITNFLNNAIKFTQKGSIRLGCNKKEEGLYFYVTDTGKGIAEENIPKVFDRFSKFDCFSQGNGLGLSISKS
ncbi:MAG: HAMP domain-containing histidine kinase, partial [Prolixibacteraceae bacterium]|nr:HAMP domain-containing histidine kinase [Prolixibacteraceae bacterium]